MDVLTINHWSDIQILLHFHVNSGLVKGINGPFTRGAGIPSAMIKFVDGWISTNKAHPFVWSAFCVHGQWQSTMSNEFHSKTNDSFVFFFFFLLGISRNSSRTRDNSVSCASSSSSSVSNTTHCISSTHAQTHTKLQRVCYTRDQMCKCEKPGTVCDRRLHNQALVPRQSHGHIRCGHQCHKKQLPPLQGATDSWFWEQHMCATHMCSWGWSTILVKSFLISALNRGVMCVQTSGLSSKHKDLRRHMTNNDKQQQTCRPSRSRVVVAAPDSVFFIRTAMQNINGTKSHMNQTYRWCCPWSKYRTHRNSADCSHKRDTTLIRSLLRQRSTEDEWAFCAKWMDRHTFNIARSSSGTIQRSPYLGGSTVTIQYAHDWSGSHTDTQAVGLVTLQKIKSELANAVRDRGMDDHSVVLQPHW